MDEDDALVQQGTAAECLGPAPAPLAAHQASHPASASGRTDSADWQDGQLIMRRWRIFGRVSGGMGHVYFVQDEQWNGLQMAVKTLTLKPQLLPAQANAAKALFRRETQVWLDLGAHPAIVSAHYTLEIDGALRLFMEYVPGGTLDALLRDTGGPLSLEHALDLSIQLAAGMEYIHSRNAVHRDLKPANCLITTDGTLRITDFGLGKALDAMEPMFGNNPEGGIQGENPSHHAMGTLHYMAPEQWHSLSAAGRPADVYAFGVVLCEMLAGTRPFELDRRLMRRYGSRIPTALAKALNGNDPNPASVLRFFHEQVPPLSLTELGGAAPAELEQIVLSCLQKDPAQRPTFAELGLALRRLYKNVTAEEYPRLLLMPLNSTEASENNRAISYFVMDQRDKAATILDRWLAHDPTALYPWLNRRMIELNSGAAQPAQVAGEFVRHIEPAHTLAVNSDSQVNAARLQLQRYLISTGTAVRKVAYSQEDASCLVVGWDGEASLFSSATGERLALLPVQVKSPGQEGAAALGELGCIVQASAGVLRCHSLGDDQARWRTLALDFIPLAVDTVGAGRLVLVGGRNKEAQLWDLHRRVLRLRVDGLGFPVHTVKFCAGGSLFLIASSLVQLFETQTGSLRATFGHPERGSSSAAISEDARLLAAGTWDGTVRLWDAETGALLHVFSGHASEVCALAFAPSGRWLATGSRDKTIAVWSIATGELLQRFQGHYEGVRTLAFHPRLPLLLSGSEDGTARVWEVEDSAGGSPRAWPLLIQQTRPAGERVKGSAALHGLLNRLRGGDNEAYKEIEDLRSRMPGWELDADLIYLVGKTCARVGSHRSIKRAISTRLLRDDSEVIAALFSADERYVLSGSCQAVRQWSLEDGSIAQAYGEERGWCSALAVTTDGQRVCSGRKNSVVSVWRAEDGAHLADLRQHRDEITSLSIDPMGSHLLVCSRDCTATVWHWPSGTAAPELQRCMGGFLRRPLLGALSPDGRFMLIANHDAPARLYSRQESSEQGEWPLSSSLDETTALAYGPDGRYVAVGCRDGATHVYRVGDGKRVCSFTEENSAITALAFSPDGRTLAAGTYTGMLHLWDLYARTGGHRLRAHRDQITAICFSSDGLRLLTSSWDHTLRLWTIDWQWHFLDSLITEIEGGRSPGRPSGSWSSPILPDRLDETLDGWAIIAQCMALSRCSSTLLRRYYKLRTNLLSQLQRLLIETGAPVQLAAEPHNILFRIGAVDPLLAADLFERCSGDRQAALSFGWFTRAPLGKADERGVV